MLWRTDAGIELSTVGSAAGTARPRESGLEGDKSRSCCSDAVRACHIGEGHHAISVADVKGVTQQRHAERLVQSLHEGPRRFSAMPSPSLSRDDVMQLSALAPTASARRILRLHHIAERAPDRSMVRGLGHEHVAVGQHLDPARVLKIGRDVTGSPGATAGFCPFAHPWAVGRLRWEWLLWFRGRSAPRRRCPGRLLRNALQLPPLDAAAPISATTCANMPEKLMRLSSQNFSAHDQPHHLVGAFENMMHAHVAQHALDPPCSCTASRSFRHRWRSACLRGEARRAPSANRSPRTHRMIRRRPRGL